MLAWTYDANGNELTYTDALNRVTSLAWDKLNRMTSETLPPPAAGKAGPVITTAYDNLSRKASQTNALSGTTAWAYANTDISQVTSETLPAPSGSGAGVTTSFGYDSDGRQDSVTDAMNHTTSTSFTADGQISQTKDNLNNVTSYAYGHLGELLSTTDSLNHTSSNQYDSRFRLVQTTDANGGITSITFDPAGNQTKLVDPDNNSTSWTVDALNRPVTETNSLGTTTTSYDASSDVTSIQDADGRVRDFTFDNLHRLTAENWMNGSTVVATMSYGYDLANQLTSATDPNSAYAFSYDGDGNVLTVDNAGTPNVPHVVLASTYDLMGDRTSQSASVAGTLDYLNNYSYDAGQRLTMVQQQGQTGGNVVASKEVDFGYNATGQYTSIAYYNTFTTPRTDVATGAYTYDGDNRLTGLTYTSNGGADAIDTLGWTYNNSSLVSTFTDNDGTATYGYDPTNQLTSATYTTAQGGHQPANESYSFDKNGNRNMTGYSTAPGNLMLSDGTFNYQHDADGNTSIRTRISNSYAADYKTTYAWDYRNRLTDVQYYDNNNALTKHVHYAYDVFNNLIGEEDDDTGSGSYDKKQWYAVDARPEIPAAGEPFQRAAQPVLQFDAHGNVTDRNLVALNPAHVDAVMAQEAISSVSQGGAVTWTAANNLGTPVYIIDNTGAVVNHLVYNSVGQLAFQSAPSMAAWSGFSGGHLSAETGLILDGFRWDDPDINAWLSQDPLGFAAGDSNLSRVAGNDPTNDIDPTGLSWGSIVTNFVVGFAVGAATAAVVTLAAPVAAGIIGVAAVTYILVGVAVVGTGCAVYNTYQAYQAGDYDQMAFNAGNITGGLFVGSIGGGRAMVTGMTGKPSPSISSWNPAKIIKNDWDMSWSAAGAYWFWQSGYVGTAPTPAMGGTAATLAGCTLLQWEHQSWAAAQTADEGAKTQGATASY